MGIDARDAIWHSGDSGSRGVTHIIWGELKNVIWVRELDGYYFCQYSKTNDVKIDLIISGNIILLCMEHKISDIY